jgi:hypothetical protein
VFDDLSALRLIRRDDYARSMTRTPAPLPSQMPADYPQLLSEVKARIAAARTRAVLAVNSELIKLYWEIGHEILAREHQEG